MQPVNASWSSTNLTTTSNCTCRVRSVVTVTGAREYIRTLPVSDLLAVAQNSPRKRDSAAHFHPSFCVPTSSRPYVQKAVQWREPSRANAGEITY